MGIMDKMREKMGIIMIILIAAFVITIVFNWGSGGFDTFAKDRDVVGVVNGEKITIKAFYETYNQALEQYRNAGVTVDARTSEMILQQTWETVVSQVLWAQEIERLGITVSDEELYHYLEANPPEFLMGQEAFLTDGVFDYGKYLNVLRNPQGNEWLEIENYLRNNILPFQKLNDIILSSVVVDETEILQKFADQSVIYSANYLAAPVHLIADSIFTVYEEDLKDYYEENKDELFKQDEQRHIRFVHWKKVPSSKDTADVIYELEDFTLRHEEGEAFDELAQIFSEDQGEGTSGDLGWFTKEELRPEYREPVFAAKAGDVLEPINVGDAFHLVKVSEINDDRVRISILIRRIDPVNTYDYYATEAEAFVLDVESYGFAKAYENVDAALDTMMGGFSKQFPYFGSLGYFPALAKWVYRSNMDDISPAYENENAYVVAQLIDVVEESYVPFEEVKATVERAVLSELKLKRSTDLALETYNEFMAGNATLLELSKANSALEYQSFSSSLDELPYPFGTTPVFSDVVRGMNTNTVSAPFPNGQYGSVFVQLTGRTTIDEELYAEKREELQQALLEEKQQTAYESWMNDLKEKADIVDNRVDFGLN